MSFGALGTTAVVAVTEPDALADARACVERVVHDFDLACSRFRADSEVSALARARGRAMRASPLLLDAVEAALRAAVLTDGDVDPTVGAALRALGYDRDFAELAERGPAQVRFAKVSGWQTIELDRAAGTIGVPAGLELDLGATAKALCADRAAAAAQAATGAGVLVSLGGDMAVVGPAPKPGWRVRVTDDHQAPDAAGQWIVLRTGGLATSSTQVRRWATETGSAHHLLDPATGQPVGGGWRTVSVCAANCLDANIASTAAIVRSERAVSWLRGLGLPSRLVSEAGTVVHLAGWPTAGEELPGTEPAVAGVGQ